LKISRTGAGVVAYGEDRRDVAVIDTDL